MSGDLGNVEANAEGKAEFHLEVRRGRRERPREGKKVD